MAGSSSTASSSLMMRESIYGKFVEKAEYREEVEKEFATVRILVLGKSGAGKSTLIRRLFGIEHNVVGPAGVSGKAGIQDTSREWRHPNLPIVFHDSNGVGSSGSQSVARVETFLNARQRDPVFSQRVHLVWYVHSVLDNRILDNAGLLSVVTRPEYNLSSKIQLIVTHNDQDKRGRAYDANVVKQLDHLLEEAGLSADAQAAQLQALKKGVAKVSNPDGASMVDLEALKKLSVKTMAFLREEQGMSWAAAQAVDVEEKVRSSAKFIVKQKLWTWLTAPLGVSLPLGISLNAWRMQMLLAATSSGLCRIWAVPLRLEQTFLENLALSLETLKPADSSFANALWATMLPGGIPDEGQESLLPLDRVALAASSVLDINMSPALVVAGAVLISSFVASSINEAYASRLVIVNYAMTVAGGIVYAKALHPSSLSGESATTFSERQYQAILDSFAATHQSSLQKKAQEARSVFLGLFDQDSQSLKIERLLRDFFLSLLAGLPTDGA